MENKIEAEKLISQLNRTIKATEFLQKDLDNLVNHFTQKVSQLGFDLYSENGVYNFKEKSTMEENDILKTNEPIGLIEKIENKTETVIYSDKFKKGYLMTSGTMFAGFTASMIAGAIMKDKANSKQIITIAFIGGLILGGIYTSKLLK